MSLSGIAKFIVGFFVGIFILTASGAAMAFYFWTRLSITPAKPIFAEEQPKTAPTAQNVSNEKAQASNPKPQSKPAASPSKPPAPQLPPGAYKARVTWSEGLSLRDAPGTNSNRVGGVMFNQEVIVLQQSGDQKWQQVRLANGEQVGWIKSGNIQKIE